MRNYTNISNLRQVLTESKQTELKNQYTKEKLAKRLAKELSHSKHKGVNNG